MAQITQNYKINASVEQVFDALTNPKVIEQWSGGPTTMNNKVGTEFTVFGGQISGKNLEVVTNKKLVQEWSTKDWEVPSTVTFTLSSNNGSTQVDLLHENVPDPAEETISGGWKEYYLGKIQAMFE